MCNGIVKKFEKGYGYILREGQRDLFFHRNDCIGWTPNIGDACEFEIGPGRDGRPSAKNVRRLQTAKINQENKPAPYHFADINLDLAIADAPVWHDGSGGDAKQRHTGKLRISLRTLTPLLVGWTSYKLGDAKSEVKAFGKKDKTVLEPFRLADGKVVIAGKSLNGMIRHSLSALLSAPMERVAERVYSYRPALKPSKAQDRLQLLPAVIQKWNGKNLKVKVFRNAHCVYFSTAEFEKMFAASHHCIGFIKQLKNSLLRDEPPPRGKGTTKHYIDKSGSSSLSNVYVFKYVGGVDACGILNEEFQKHDQITKNEESGRDEAVDLKPLHRYAAVRSTDYDSAMDAEISDDCIKHYIETLLQLGDTEHGHLASGHPLMTDKKRHDPSSHDKIKLRTKKEIADGTNQALKDQIKLWDSSSGDSLINRLIYVEIENQTIRSFGHNFQYRTRYVDSVRLQGKDKQVREILKPLGGEIVKETADNNAGTPPERLSGARLFCGYVSRREPTKAWHEQGSDNIGSGTHLRLKGRIGCGFAVEYWELPPPPDTWRFLPGTGNGQFLIPLKPLGMPRPSAVEHYLRQPQAADITAKRHDGAGLLTYGDLPNVPGGAADGPGELAGRKFYRHQTEAASDPTCYTDIGHVGSNQAALGRYISKANTVFRFTLDFQDLRDWELGALLVTVFPSHCLPALAAKLDAQNLKDKLDALNRQADEQRPALAHKLGHGRPLGLGSVLLDLDEAELLDVDAGGMPRLDKQDGLDGGLPDPGSVVGKTLANCLAAFADKLLETKQSADLARHLERWAAVHRYAGQERAAYPLAKTKENRQDVMRIYAHHTNIRKDHMRDRRQPAPKPEEGCRDGRALDEPNLDDPS